MNDSNLYHSSNAAFSQSNTQTDPFTGELKGGEFPSDYGTNTNAVSQMFKGGGLGSQSKGRLILIGVIALGLLGGAFWYMSEPMDGETTAEAPEEATDEAAEPDTAVEEEPKPVTEAKAEPAPAPAPVAEIKLISPASGAVQAYDETQGPSEFQWEGAADQIIFSRSSTMQPAVRVHNVNGANSFSFEHPYPGTWYWQVRNSAGMSEVSSFTISAPTRRSFPVSQPTPGGNIAGSGGVVTWQAGEKIARYSVELTPAGSSFANPSHRFGTSGTSVALQAVPAGVYDVRVGAFSEVAGRWEWQVIEKVNVQ